jgi:hypothetical protein
MSHTIKDQHRTSKRPREHKPQVSNKTARREMGMDLIAAQRNRERRV